MKNQNVKKKQLQTGFPFICYEDRFALCGQPQEEDFKEFKQEAWSCIINLRNPEELDSLNFKVPELCQKWGLDYNNIPVITKGDLDKDAFRKIHNLLSHSDKEKKFVIHCASGVRSILALIAHLIFSGDHNKEELTALSEEFNFKGSQMFQRLFELMDV